LGATYNAGVANTYHTGEKNNSGVAKQLSSEKIVSELLLVSCCAVQHPVEHRVGLVVRVRIRVRLRELGLRLY